MLSFIDLVIIAVLILIGSVLYWYLSMPKNVPPGPLGLPFIGYPIRFDDQIAHLAELAKQYGDVFSYYAGKNLVVVITGHKCIKDLIVKEGDSFVDRWSSPLLLTDNPRNLGLINDNGAVWKEQRRFALSTLRDFGFGKPVLESSIHDEVQQLCEQLEQHEGEQVDLKFHLNAAVSNIICQLTFGERYDYNDSKFFDVLEQMNIRIGSVKLTQSMAYQTWMWLVPSFRAARSAVKSSDFAIANYILNAIKQHKQTYDTNSEPTNYIDAFLKQQSTGQGDYFDDEQLMWAVISLFSAGTETTSTTLRWGILFCSLHPDVQEKLHQEIVQTVGSSSFPTMADRTKLDYTEAVLLEVQRIASLVPIFVRQTVREVKYNGYHIPAGCPVLVHSSSVHCDPRLYPDPHAFKPERFLDNGKLKHDEWLMPFGAGKRVCLGESLARMELFLFFAALMQRFKFSLVPGEPKPSATHVLGLTSQPVPFKVIITSRAS